MVPFSCYLSIRHFFYVLFTLIFDSKIVLLLLLPDFGLSSCIPNRFGGTFSDVILKGLLLFVLSILVSFVSFLIRQYFLINLFKLYCLTCLLFCFVFFIPISVSLCFSFRSTFASCHSFFILLSNLPSRFRIYVQLPLNKTDFYRRLLLFLHRLARLVQ